MSLKQNARSIAEEKGLTESSLLTLALNFIESRSLHNSFLDHLDLETDADEHENNEFKDILCFDEVMSEWDESKNEYNEEFGIYICEIGVFDNDDTNTAHEIHKIAVIGTANTAESIAIDYLRNDLGQDSNTILRAAADIDKLDFADFSKDIGYNTWSLIPE